MAARKSSPDLAVVYRNPADLKADPKNSRTHSADQIERIRASIREFGFTNPILLREDETTIGAGHARQLAAIAERLKRVPTIVLRGLTDVQWRAYVIADNKLALDAGWNEDLLRLEFAALKALDFNVTLTGFTLPEIAIVEAGAGTAGLTDPDDAPEPPANPVSRLGDVWLLGAHRLVCGDSTDAATVAKAMDGAKARLVITDPPYGVDYTDIRDSIRRSGRGGKKYEAIANDQVDGPKLQAFLEAILRASLPHLVDNPAFYLWHPMLTQGTFFAAAAAADILIHRQIIWVKKSLILGRGDYHWRHELCFYGWIRGKRCDWYAGRDQTTVWEIGRENDGIHPTQKPIECMKRPIENNSQPGDAVYEPFCGSGTTIIAAEMTARRCIAIELSPAYIDVAVQRWQNFTGKAATLEATGQTWEEVKDAHLADARS